MEYYIYLVLMLLGMMTIAKIAFCEVEGRTARKKNAVNWYNKMGHPFVYRRTRGIMIMCAMCYAVASGQEGLSVEWFLELIVFMAIGVIYDAISQVFGYYYCKLRFKNDIQKGLQVQDEINTALKDDSESLMEKSLESYSSHSIISKYFNDDLHLAITSIDGGHFATSFTNLPPITYLIDSDKANELIGDRSIKLISLTEDGKYPFKDEKLDLVVNELANYDKYDLYRVVKPGGHIIIEQLGSDNYKEILGMFFPFKINGIWDSESCQNTLSEIGLEIVDSYEERGTIRFDTLTAFIQFIKGIIKTDQGLERFSNFYAKVLNEIKENKYYEITTHRFMVIARKKEL